MNPIRNLAPATETGLLERPGRTKRFTLDGSEDLESHLTQVCEQVSADIQKVIPARKLEALVLGGGYGRGEGGVLKTEKDDRPYNDLEFYVFLRGNRFGNERKYGDALRESGRRLSPKAGLHIEFKVDSLARLRRSPVTMFSYDLVSGHRVLAGSRFVFRGCEHHLNADKIPLTEATRLLMNRCSGLLFAREKLTHEPFTADDADFVGRNIAKARLAFGDAVLTAFGQYHWSCRARHDRLLRFSPPEILSWLDEVRRHHAAGMEFKLHPRQTFESGTALKAQHAEITTFALQIWLWLENRRLGSHFESAQDYALSPADKCSGTRPWRNFFVNAKVFGLPGLFQPNWQRHPRERILNALALLLWEGHTTKSTVRSQLHNASLSLDDDIAKWTAVYQTLWSKLC
ncbi:MAG TPA: hypothetical protein VG077_18030 [Verrucomicrobiae bacterium]|nr:hypothetical protein [Verrucomicrobiae bacterium]